MSPDHAFHSKTQQLVAYLIIGAGLFARWPVLHTGFIVDDYAQLAMMRGDYPVPRSALSLFTFSDGSDHENVRLRATGFFPWWSNPALRVSLMRPISSALMWVDLRAFGHDAFAYHLHSASWWLAMMLCIHAVLRRLLIGWMVPLALCLIALHPAHAVLLGWIANRNAMVATTFALAGLWAQLRAQRESWRPGYPLAGAGYALGLLASEYATGYLAYGVCLTLFDARPKSTRVRQLCTWAFGLGSYAALRAALGFGTYGSGMYIDPVREPGAFLAAASARFPVLVADLVLAIRSSWWSGGFPWGPQLVLAGWVPASWAAGLGPFRALQVALGVAVALVSVVPLARFLRSAPRHDAYDLRFVAAGVPLALLPALASLPESRLMLPALVGWAALLAKTTVDRWVAWRQTRLASAAIGCALALGLCLIETALPTWYGAGEIRGLPALAHGVRGAILDPNLDRLLGRGHQALLLSAVDPTTTIYIPLVRKWHGRPTPDSCQLLMGSYGPLRLTRTSPSAFVLERLQSELTAVDVYASAFNRLPLHDGQRFSAGDMAVHVERTVNGRATRVRYELQRSLDDPGLVLLEQTAFGLHPLSFPMQGQSTLVAPAGLPLPR
jgi:hypothetical protein